MSKRTKEQDSIPTAERTSKTMWFEKGVLEAFTRRAEQNGQDAHELFRRFLRQYVAGTYVGLDLVEDEIKHELEAKRSEMGVRQMEPVVESVLTEWARRRVAERATKKR